MEKLNIGVIGGGTFGRYHSQKLAAHDQVNFVGVYDVRLANAEAICAEVGGEAFSDEKALLKRCDALVIACPASYHAEYALKAIEAGCHVLVEKPLATNLRDAEQIVARADAAGVTVQVGHQERFVLRAIGLDRIAETPSRIEARRLNTYSERGTDTSVTLDLMTHDLDMVLWLMGRTDPVVSGRSEAVRSQYPDDARATLTFEASEASLEASRVAETGSRVMTLTYPSGGVIIDFNAKTLVNETEFDLNADFAARPEAKDSLAAGTAEFVSCLLEGRVPLISGQDGLNAVRLACQIDQ